MSYLLRHDPEDLVMDKNGWVNVIVLLAKLGITFDELKDIVLTNDKKRFAFNDEETQIRASQGHSLKRIDVELKEQIPPKYLYHGTAARNLTKINKKGLQKMNRNHVHLSEFESTAKEVGKRYSKSIFMFKINTTPMMLDGIKFYISANGVWLVDEVKPQYLTHE